MQAVILISLMKKLISFFGEDALKEFATMALTFIKEKAESSDNKYDDTFLIPACIAAEKSLMVPGTDVIGVLLEQIMLMLKGGAMKEFADKMLDWIEDKAKSTDTKYDDMILLPMTATIRAAFNIPDND